MGGGVDDNKLFLAIRNDCINFYFRGCSVLKLNWSDRKKEITGEIHYKYLLKPSIKDSPYVKFDEAGRRLPWKLGDLFLDNLNKEKINELKQSVKGYTDAEKSGVHDVVMSVLSLTYFNQLTCFVQYFYQWADPKGPC